MMGEDHHIDEGLYSRQLYVLGHAAMRRMASSHVLVIGLGGLGVEIAKNVALAGVKSITLYDPTRASLEDLTTQYFLTENDMGKPRDVATAPRLAELNPYVTIAVHSGQLTTAHLSSFSVVVCTGIIPLETQIEWNEVCRKSGTCWICTETRGLFGYTFCDFGPEFTVSDDNGEQPISGIVASIDEEGIVTCADENRHGLETGDYVQFREIVGMDRLNAEENPRQVTVLGPYTFSVGDVSQLGTYIRGGVFTQVKVPKTFQFKSLKDSLDDPDFVVSDFAKFDRPLQLHAGFRALAQHTDNIVPPTNPRDPQYVEHILTRASEYLKDQEMDTDLIRALAFQAHGSVAPVNAVIGGLAAQEVLKACSGKFTPLRQYLYFDALEALPADLTPEDCQPMGSRYDAQVKVFGRRFQERLGNVKQFLVGAGAIGCEMLKLWAMMGLGTGPSGVVHVTDMDSIEKSNLNRQFLFRPSDVGHMKSKAAVHAIERMNPLTKNHYIAHQDRVCEATEHVFNDNFWSTLDGVTNALDNVEARRYVDQRCVFYQKPLLESGTLGTKGNTQVVVPFLTESYSSSSDPPEKSIPLCTLKSFPNQIEHTIQWSRELFENLFKNSAESVNQYLTQPNYIDELMRKGQGQKETLETLLSFLVTERPLSFEACVAWARLRFQEYYHNQIRQLLYNFPRDHVTESGQPFWNGAKRAPTALDFDETNPLHMDFIVAAANLHAFNYGLRGTHDIESIRQMVRLVKVPAFEPRKGVKIQVTENEANDAQDATMTSYDEELDNIIKQLPDSKTLAGFRLSPVEFEKDDDTNFHIDFITAASNLRAVNYAIPVADRHQTKGVAGKIIPAIATTTALVAGLVCIELYKLIQGRTRIEDYKNGFVNLALPFFGFSEPIAAPKNKYYDTEWTLWDRIEMNADMTLQEFIDIFQRDYNLEVTMISCHSTLLYTFFTAPKTKKERLTMKMVPLIEHVSRKKLDPSTKSLVLVVCVNDHDGEDVEIPYVLLRI